MEDFAKLIENLQDAYKNNDKEKFNSIIDLMKKEFKSKSKVTIIDKNTLKEKLSNLRVISKIKKVKKITYAKLSELKSSISLKIEQKRKDNLEEKKEKQDKKLKIKAKKALENKNIKSNFKKPIKKIMTLGKDSISYLKSTIDLKYNDFKLKRENIKEEKKDEKLVKQFEKQQEKEMKRNEKATIKAQRLEKKEKLKIEKKQANKTKYVARHLKPSKLSLFKQKLKINFNFVNNVKDKFVASVENVKEKVNTSRSNIKEDVGIALYIIKDKSSIIGKSVKRKFETGKKTIIKIPGFLVEKSKKKMDDLSKKADKIIDNLENKKNENQRKIDLLKLEREKLKESMKQNNYLDHFSHAAVR